ncbi:MAG: Do family serine endopeptidase [Pseudomonadota bacterium]
MIAKHALFACVMGLTACAASAAPVAPNGDTGVGVIRVNAERVVPETRAEITLSFAPVVKQAAPAVVNIYTKKVVERRASPFAGDPFFERFFSDMFPAQRSRRRIENSLGSGVILDSGGIVVSNHHVVAGADEITVVLQDRREFQGRVIFADEDSDLAVVQLDEAADLPTLSLRDSDTLEVGDLVLAIGNPFGVGQTVTSGIVSGLARSGGARRGGSGLFIQTDAAINPGNSGGALVDMEGRLVGVNTAILSRSGGSNGIGFAVPANLVARVVNSAGQGQTELVRPWLGLDGQTVDGELASALGLLAPMGILIKDLHPESPLAAAGLKRGDVITDIDGAAVNTLQELDFRASTKPLGNRAEIGYLRDDTERAGSIALSAAPDTPPPDRRTLGRDEGLPGLTLVNVNPALIDELDLPVSMSGVLVLGSKGPARRVGVRSGDLLRRVDGSPVRSVAEAAAALTETRGDVVLDIERNGRTGQVRYRR